VVGRALKTGRLPVAANQTLLLSRNITIVVATVLPRKPHRAAVKDGPVRISAEGWRSVLSVVIMAGFLRPMRGFVRRGDDRFR
jgi:hypothetical protein